MSSQVYCNNLTNLLSRERTRFPKLVINTLSPNRRTGGETLLNVAPQPPGTVTGSQAQCPQDRVPGNTLAYPRHARDTGSAGISGTQLSPSATGIVGATVRSWLSSSWERRVGLKVQVSRRKRLTPVVPLDGGSSQRNETIMNGATRGPCHHIHPVSPPPQEFHLHRLLGPRRSGLQKGLGRDVPNSGISGHGFIVQDLFCEACVMGKDHKRCKAWFVTDFLCDPGQFLCFYWPPFPHL